MKREERHLLIDSLLDGSINEANLLRIEAEMSVDPEVRQEYYRRLQLELLLERETHVETATAKSTATEAAAERAMGRRMLPLVSVTLIALAAAVLLMINLARPADETIADVDRSLISQQSINDEDSAKNVNAERRGDSDNHDAEQVSGQSKQTEEPSASGFAILSGHDGAIWSGMTIGEGDLIPSGELQLTAGRVHIELFSGVEMVIEGESVFSIDSAMQVTMKRGAARARVPEPAQGFRIKTAAGDVVDLGTEFSVDVDDHGADVHVVDGEVELYPQSDVSLQPNEAVQIEAVQVEAVRIDAGRSRRLASSGGLADVLSPATELLGPTEFQKFLRSKQQQRLAQWHAANEQAFADPRAVAYYRFHNDQSSSRQIANLTESSASNGTVVGAVRTADRWGRSGGALDFSRIGSRMRVNVPGEYRGLTMMCWVKVNSLDRWYNSLFLTDGHDPREPHWQWMDDGRIFFSVKVPPVPAQATADQATADQATADPTPVQQPVFYSPKVWDASLSGRWIMLAVTYDVDRGQVTHYLNGEPIGREAIAKEALVDAIRIGPASVGNWSEPMYRTDPEFVLRNLNGSMDEFAVYSGALSDEKILQLYRLGNPNEL